MMPAGWSALVSVLSIEAVKFRGHGTGLPCLYGDFAPDLRGRRRARIVRRCFLEPE